MTKPSKIAYVLGEFPSATEYFILNEINGLARLGLSIKIMALAKPALPFTVKASETVQPQVIYYNRFSPLNLVAALYCCINYPRNYFSLLAEFIGLLFTKPPAAMQRLNHLLIGSCFIYRLRNEDVKHLHAHFASAPAAIALLISSVTGTPYSVSAHANDIYADNAALERNLKSARFVITCTRANQHVLQNVEGAPDVSCIYHGIDPGLWPYKLRQGIQQPGTVRLLTVGRLVEKKGISYLLKAVKALHGSYPIQCTIVGEGPERSRLQQEIDRLGLAGSVHLAGAKPQDELLASYYAHDIFVLPSVVAVNGDRDGLPNVLPEAMATGIPVVSTAVSAIPELIESGRNGLLVEERSDTALAEAIRRLISDPQLYQTLSVNGRETIKNEFNMEHGNSRVLDLFNRLS